jgi:hypothetical protein
LERGVDQYDFCSFAWKFFTVLVSCRYGKFGYGFGRGSFNISREQYAAAVAAVWGAALSSIAADFDRLPPVEPMTLIIRQYNSPGGSCCCCCCC